MPEFRNTTTIETPLGLVKVESLVSADELVEDQVSLTVARFEPSLPEGMVVQKCTAVLLVIEGLVELEKFHFGLSFECKVPGYPDMGQYLSALEWRRDGKLIVIGTEDGEGLAQRIPKLSYLEFEEKDAVDLTSHSMTLNLSDLPILMRPSFHFIIAENPDPEPIGLSAWFAVDEGHKNLLKLCNQGPPDPPRQSPPHSRLTYPRTPI